MKLKRAIATTAIFVFSYSADFNSSFTRFKNILPYNLSMVPPVFAAYYTLLQVLADKELMGRLRIVYGKTLNPKRLAMQIEKDPELNLQFRAKVKAAHVDIQKNHSANKDDAFYNILRPYVKSAEKKLEQETPTPQIARPGSREAKKDGGEDKNVMRPVKTETAVSVRSEDITTPFRSFDIVQLLSASAIGKHLVGGDYTKHNADSERVKGVQTLLMDFVNAAIAKNDVIFFAYADLEANAIPKELDSGEKKALAKILKIIKGDAPGDFLKVSGKFDLETRTLVKFIQRYLNYYQEQQLSAEITPGPKYVRAFDSFNRTLASARGNLQQSLGSEYGENPLTYVSKTDSELKNRMNPRGIVDIQLLGAMAIYYAFLSGKELNGIKMPNLGENGSSIPVPAERGQPTREAVKRNAEDKPIF